MRALLYLLPCFGLLTATAPDVAALYSVDTQGTSPVVQSGRKGVLVLAIHTQKGAHVSNEAPLKIELSGPGVALEKTVLSYSDASSKAPTQLRFEVPFAAQSPGQTALSVKMVFFICTEKLCVRQQKALEVPVKVEPPAR
jgi:hypothetical protein